MSFLSATSELRRIEKRDPRDSDWNPITETTSISFRTRESQARLLFAYDHLQNFINIHMSKPNEIVVMWNSGSTLQHTSVDTGHHELNTSRAVVVTVARTDTATQVTVAVDEQVFGAAVEGAREPIEEYQEKPFIEEPLLDLLPHYPQPVTAPAAFLSVHLGGAALSRQPDVMPGLVGCIDSFAVTDQRASLQDEQLWHPTGDVKRGCPSSCAAEEACAHGGVCLDSVRADHSHPRCDCANTGYDGGDCLHEVSFTFRGNDSLELHYDEPTLDLELAFASEGFPSATPELLFYWQNEGLQVGVAVEGAERLLVWGGPHHTVYKSVLRPDQLQANMTQRGRHRLHLTGGNATLSLEFDGRRVPLRAGGAVACPRLPTDALFIGGVRAPKRIGGTATAGFKGCISNVKLVTSSGRVFSPLEVYQRSQQEEEVMPELVWASNITATDRCSSPVLPILIGASRVTGPQGGTAWWSLPSLEVRSDGGVKYQPPGTEPSYIVIIVCSAIAAFLLLVMIIAAAIWCWNRSKRRVEGNQTRDQQHTIGGRSYRKSSPPVRSSLESGLLGALNPQLPVSTPAKPASINEPLLTSPPSERDMRDQFEMRTPDGDDLHQESMKSNEACNQSWSSQHLTGSATQNPVASPRSATIPETPNGTALLAQETHQIQDKDIRSMRASDLYGNSLQTMEPDLTRMPTDGQGATTAREGGLFEDSSNTAHRYPNEMCFDGNQFDQESTQDLPAEYPLDYDPQSTGDELGNRFQEYVPRENPSELAPLIHLEQSPGLFGRTKHSNARIVDLVPSSQQTHCIVNSVSDESLTREANRCSATFPNDEGANGQRLQQISSYTDEGRLPAQVAVDDEDPDMFQTAESLLVQPTPLVHTAQIISRTQSNAPNYDL